MFKVIGEETLFNKILLTISTTLTIILTIILQISHKQFAFITFSFLRKDQKHVSSFQQVGGFCL